MMRVLGYIIAASIALAALQLAVQVVIFGLLIALVISLIHRPAETLAWVLMLMTYSFVMQHPLVAIPALVAITVIKAWRLP